MYKPRAPDSEGIRTPPGHICGKSRTVGSKSYNYSVKCKRLTVCTVKCAPQAHFQHAQARKTHKYSTSAPFFNKYLQGPNMTE